MRRNVFLMMLLFVLLGSPLSALAGHGRLFCRRHRATSPCWCPCHLTRDFYCLEDIVMDFGLKWPQEPSDDLFICLVNEGSCPAPSPYEDLWFGTPGTTSLPETCALHNCEYEDIGAHRGHGHRPRGHGEEFPGQTFADKATAFNWIANHYPGTPPAHSDYYEIPLGNQTVPAVVVRLPGPGNHYFGVETQDLGTPDSATFTKVEPRNTHKSVLYVEYTDGDSRTALIWREKSHP